MTGFWHGAQWNFLLWGLYYAILLLLEKLVLHRLLDRLPKVLRWLYTMFFVVVGWVIFNLTDFGQMLAALKQMFTFPATDWISMVAANTSILYALFYIPLGLVCMLPLGRRVKLGESAWGTALSHLIYMTLAGICVIMIVSSEYNPFIYFRF